MQVSVVIPTHNPRPEILAQALDALRQQTLPRDRWELVVVDNASRAAVASHCDLAWHPAGRLVREERLGLTAARLAGFNATRGEVVVLVDDDNLLAPDYLAVVERIAADFPRLGSWSGNVELVFEPGAVPPPAGWRSYLTERVCRNVAVTDDPGHNDSTPWGAGLCVRRELARSYVEKSRQDPDLLRLDLQGTQLLYGGDTDIAYHGCAIGLLKGVFPELSLRHLIPAGRCTREYLLRSIEGHAYSECLHHWVRHKELPREDTRPIERAKQLVRYLRSDAATRAKLDAQRRGRARARRDLTAQS